MRSIIFVLFALITASPTFAEAPSQFSGIKVIESNQPFDTYLGNLTEAIKANKMGIVSQACATCGAKSIGVTIPGNQVFMIFNPYFAVRMLEANTASGIEAPLRLYITEKPDGTAQLTYRLPSEIFAPYEVPALDEMASELDMIFENIVSAANAASAASAAN